MNKVVQTETADFVAWRFAFCSLLLSTLFGCTDSPPAPAIETSRATARETATTDMEANADAKALRGSELVFPDPSASEPVTAAMEIRPELAAPGDTIEVLVHARIGPRYYLHAPDDKERTFIPVSVELAVPDGVEPVADWKFPSPEVQRGSRVYRDSLLLRRNLQLAKDLAPQVLNLTGKLRYQACTDELCWPPRTIGLSTTLSVQANARSRK